MDNGGERELVRRMLGGDEGAFDEFFADYFPRLFRFAVVRLRDPDAAEDIVQTSLIAAVRAPRSAPPCATGDRGAGRRRSSPGSAPSAGARSARGKSGRRGA